MSAVETLVPAQGGSHTTAADQSGVQVNTYGTTNADSHSVLEHELNETMLGGHDLLDTPVSFDAYRGVQVNDTADDATLRASCSLWFERYHPWFPILHQPSLVRRVAMESGVNQSKRSLVLQAINVVTKENLAVNDLVRIRDTIVLRALSTATLDSVQALLIISISEYGNGELTRTWNLVAICRR